MFLITSIGSLHLHIDEQADLSYAKIEGIDLPTGPLPAMNEATFVRCVFDPTTIFPENMADVVFVDCRMQGLRLENASLFGAQFIHCDLGGSVFADCDLSAAQFVDCKLDHTVFKGCDLDTATFNGDYATPVAA